MANPAFIQLNGNVPHPGAQGHLGPRPVHPQHVQPGYGHTIPRTHQAQPRPNRPLVEVVDIRQDYVSEAQMREFCTRYEIIRFEKSTDGDPDDDEDENGNNRSAWERVTRTEVQGMSRKETVREIRRLNTETLDVVQKRADLPPALQRQLDIALNMLTREDSERGNYIWTLAQMDHQLREVIDLSSAIYDDRERVLRVQRRPPRSKKHRSSSKRRSSSSLPPIHKVSLERMSLTAYFKRSPSPHADVQFLYHEMKGRPLAAPQGGAHQYWPMNGPGGQNMPNMQNAHAGPIPMRGPPPGVQNMPQGRGAPPGVRVPNVGLNTGRGVPAGVRVPNNGGRGAGQQQGGRRPPVNRNPQPKNRNPQRRRGHSSGSDSESDSDSSSGSASDSSDSDRSRTTLTTDTQSSRSFDKGRGRNRNRSRRRPTRPRESSRAFGVESPRRHVRQEARFVADAGGRIFSGAAPPPPIIHTVPVVDRVRDAELFEAGREAERNRRRSPQSPPVVRTTASDIERMVDDAFMAGRRRNHEDRHVEEFGDHTRPIPGSRIVPPGRVFAGGNARFSRIPRMRGVGTAARPAVHTTRTDDPSLGNRGWEYRGSRTPRYGSQVDGDYDSDCYTNSFGEEDDDDFVRDIGIQEVPLRPGMPSRRRTASYVRQEPIYRPTFEPNSPANPFTPRYTPRGRSLERPRW